MGYIGGSGGGSGVGGSTGSTDNRMLRSDGTGGATVQASTVDVDDAGNIVTAGSVTSTAGYIQTVAGFRSYTYGSNISFPADGQIMAKNGSGNTFALFGLGSAVASAAALPVPTGSVFHVTGTTSITSITTTGLAGGLIFTMVFDGVLTVTSGNNLKLASNFTTAANSALTLAFDGTNFYEVGRKA